MEFRNLRIILTLSEVKGKNLSNNKGQFLVELLIAFAIFAIALVAMASLNVGGIRLF